MARKKHQEDDVLYSLSRKNDCKVFKHRNIIEVLNGLSIKPRYQLSNDLGNGSWGKIDFLCNHHGYRQMFVAEFADK